jgi:hypothetical protein
VQSCAIFEVDPIDSGLPEYVTALKATTHVKQIAQTSIAHSGNMMMIDQRLH